MGVIRFSGVQAIDPLVWSGGCMNSKLSLLSVKLFEPTENLWFIVYPIVWKLLGGWVMIWVWTGVNSSSAAKQMFSNVYISFSVYHCVLTVSVAWWCSFFMTRRPVKQHRVFWKLVHPPTLPYLSSSFWCGLICSNLSCLFCLCLTVLVAYNVDSVSVDVCLCIYL